MKFIEPIGWGLVAGGSVVTIFFFYNGGTDSITPAFALTLIGGLICFFSLLIRELTSYRLPKKGK